MQQHCVSWHVPVALTNNRMGRVTVMEMGVGGVPLILFHSPNPIVGKQLPDPTIIHAADGNFYLYVTQQDNIYIPIYKSTNMTQWTYAGAAFLQNRTGSRTLAYGLRTLTISMVNMCSIILLGTGTCLRIVVSGWRSATLL